MSSRQSALQVLLGPGCDKGKANLLTSGGRGVGHILSQHRVALHVVEAGQSAYSVKHSWVSGNVLNLLPADVHYCSAFPKPIYIFLSMTLRALDVGETRGFMKAMVDADTDQILGAAMLGIEGGEIMATVEVAMMGNLPPPRFVMVYSPIPRWLRR